MTYFRTIIVYYKELPKSIKYTTHLYFGTVLTYNAICAYYNSKQKLLDYRNDNLETYLKDKIKNEWAAVKYGASENTIERFFNSIIWPINIISDIIPSIVLQLNKSNNNGDSSDNIKK